jgi:hypothetical protein
LLHAAALTDSTNSVCNGWHAYDEAIQCHDAGAINVIVITE